MQPASHRGSHTRTDSAQTHRTTSTAHMHVVRVPGYRQAACQAACVPHRSYMNS